MLIKDTDVLARLKEQARNEKILEDVGRFCENQTKSTIYVDSVLDPSIIPARLGKTMTSQELEKKLLKLNHRFIFKDHPTVSSKKFLYIPENGRVRGAEDILQNDDAPGLTLICKYERGHMPEFSIMKRSYVEIPDMSYKVSSRADLPKSEWTKEGFIYDQSVPQPGIKKIPIVSGELVRGWRTVLLKIVTSGFATPAEVERIFGTTDSAVFQGKIGNRTDAPRVSW